MCIDTISLQRSYHSYSYLRETTVWSLEGRQHLSEVIFKYEGGVIDSEPKIALRFLVFSPEIGWVSFFIILDGPPYLKQSFWAVSASD
jgi:hypothetical protein